MKLPTSCHSSKVSLSPSLDLGAIVSIIGSIKPESNGLRAIFPTKLVCSQSILLSLAKNDQTKGQTKSRYTAKPFCFSRFLSVRFRTKIISMARLARDLREFSFYLPSSSWRYLIVSRRLDLFPSLGVLLDRML
jgi:hypothetical protein